MPIKNPTTVEINRADVRVGDRKHHRNYSERPPAAGASEPVVNDFEQDGLADDEHDGHDRVNVDVSFLEIVQANPPGNAGRGRSNRRRGRNRRPARSGTPSVFSWLSVSLRLHKTSAVLSLPVAAVYGKDANILAPEAFFLTLHDSDSGQTKMADAANKYPENVDGKFYVDDQCIDCDLCRETAPANFKRNDDGGHSFVYKQPESPEEEALCKEAHGRLPGRGHRQRRRLTGRARPRRDRANDAASKSTNDQTFPSR